MIGSIRHALHHPRRHQSDNVAWLTAASQPLPRDTLAATSRPQCSSVLVCIPCFNSQGTIARVVEPLLRHSDADVLLVDDGSDVPLADYISRKFPHDAQRLHVLRPPRKVYSGGAKNIGIAKALAENYRVVILLDSDIVTPPDFVQRMKQYFQANSREVIVAPSILPDGTWCQYADTLINFSTYLPERRRHVRRKGCLAGYAFALNMDIFRRCPCFHIDRYGGDDILFFRKLQNEFRLAYFPMLTQLAVQHLPPRSTLRAALAAQRRYGRAFFTHNDCRREYLFNKLPLLHLLTPRFWLMMVRLLRRRRYRDLAFLPLCWCLDFSRALQIVRLSLAGYRDPAKSA